MSVSGAPLMASLPSSLIPRCCLLPSGSWWHPDIFTLRCCNAFPYGIQLFETSHLQWKSTFTAGFTQRRCFRQCFGCVTGCKNVTHIRSQVWQVNVNSVFCVNRYYYYLHMFYIIICAVLSLSSPHAYGCLSCGSLRYAVYDAVFTISNVGISHLNAVSFIHVQLWVIVYE